MMMTMPCLVVDDVVLYIAVSLVSVTRLLTVSPQWLNPGGSDTGPGGATGQRGIGGGGV